MNFYLACRIKKRQSSHTEQPLTMESTLKQHEENQTEGN